MDKSGRLLLETPADLQNLLLLRKTKREQKAAVRKPAAAPPAVQTVVSLIPPDVICIFFCSVAEPLYVWSDLWCCCIFAVFIVIYVMLFYSTLTCTAVDFKCALEIKLLLLLCCNT